MTTDAMSTASAGQIEGAGASSVLGATPDVLSSPAKAAAEIERLKGNADFRKALLTGDAEKGKLWRDLFKAAHPTPAQPEQTEVNSIDLGILKHAGIDLGGEVGADLKALLTGKPTTPEIKQAAESRYQALKRDRAFVQRFLDGDAEAKRTFTTLNAIRSARVA